MEQRSISCSVNLGSYLSLSAEVYDLSKPHPPEDAYSFYFDYAKAAKGLILEPMCAAGRFLLPLFKAGFRVHGFDASPHMLAKLYAKAKAQSLKPKVGHGFVQDLDRSEKYDLIVIPSGSFCLIKAFDLNQAISANDEFIVYECRK